jgi:hypothetical protein
VFVGYQAFQNDEATGRNAVIFGKDYGAFDEDAQEFPRFELIAAFVEGVAGNQ